MSAASIIYAHQWDQPRSQYYVAVSPSKDELALYESSYEDRSWKTSKIAQAGELDNIQCSYYSPTAFGHACAGISNGTVYYTDINGSSYSAGADSVKFVPRQYRPCNSVSMNVGRWIAAGLDKVRGDNSLLIWDLETQSNNLSKSLGDNTFKTPLQSYLPNEAVLSVEFLPNDPNLLLCGSYKFIRELDLRANTTNFQCTGKSAHGISVNPHSVNYFASYSEDGAFTLWDRRHLKSGLTTGEPALLFNRFFGEHIRKNSSACFRFSRTRSSEFAMLQGGDTVRRWQIGTVPSSSRDALKKAATTTTTTTTTATTTSGGDYLASKDYDTIFVASVLDSKTDFDKVVSFDYSPDLTCTNKLDYICIRQSGQVFRMNVIEAPDAIVFDPYNNVALAEPTRLTLLKSHSEPKTIPSKNHEAEELKEPKKSEEPEENLDDKLATNKLSEILHNVLIQDVIDDSDEEAEEPSSSMPMLPFRDEGVTDYHSLLGNDISVTMMNRAIEGYSTDCEKNIAVLTASRQDRDKLPLRYIWKWIALSDMHKTEGLMQRGQLDLSLEGVYGIWAGTKDLKNQKRTIKGARKVSENEYRETITQISKSTGKTIFIDKEFAKGPKEVYRQLCLKVVGWNFERRELANELEKLKSNDRYEQAAGWALFHDDVDGCVKALAGSRKERLRLMSTAVAGYTAYKDSADGNLWRTQCQRLATDLDDPYLRAIFAFITYGSWDDVLDETSLPLVERLGIAFRFLPDDRLTTFLSQTTERAVREGDLEGIILTGMTPRLVDLLQQYVDKTSDVQTAALIASFGCPRYFDDSRVNNWVKDYRGLLNHWRLFNIRAKFDVARTALSKTATGSVTNQQVPRQIYLRCGHCMKIISGVPSNANSMGRSSQAAFSLRCPHCNNQLPRCAVCLLPLGTSAHAFDLSNAKKGEIFDQWPTYCLSCNHGLHAGHAREWFSKYDICPVPDCECFCNSK